jgi:hypothetical protein
MANKSRFLVALPEINLFFKTNASKIYSHSDLKSIFLSNYADWRLPNYMNFELFIKQLQEHFVIKQVEVGFSGKKIRRLYSFGEFGVDNLAVSLYPNAYLSHLSAVQYFEEFGKSDEPIIYVTKEQSKKYINTQKKRDELLQENIDRAFKNRSANLSGEKTYIGNHQLMILRGKYSNNLGVLNIEKGKVRLTNPERTLIDITVRPFYSGGVQRVLNTFKEFYSNLFGVDVKLLNEYLKRMDFIYPYHQAIGFYLEKSGRFKDAEIDIFRRQPRLYDFYLDYDMRDVEYSKEWKIYYPSNLVFS